MTDTSVAAITPSMTYKELKDALLRAGVSNAELFGAPSKPALLAVAQRHGLHSAGQSDPSEASEATVASVSSALVVNPRMTNATAASAAAQRRLESSRNRVPEQRLKPSVAAAAMDVASAASPTTEVTPAAADFAATEDTRRADALAIAEKTDWSDLVPAGAGFRIVETAERGLQLEQLEAVFAHLQRRVQSELWMTRPPGGKATPIELPEEVTLYTCATYVILPATVREKTSLVELVATGPQLPRWFVSHWWGEPVADFLACLTQHAEDRKLSGENACYWICAYANNQWELSDSLSDDPFQTSFNKALSMVRGTVTIIDSGGVVYSRIWCAFEAYVTITTGRPEYKWDVYTTRFEAREGERVRVTTDDQNFGRR